MLQLKVDPRNRKRAIPKWGKSSKQCKVPKIVPENKASVIISRVCKHSSLFYL